MRNTVSFFALVAGLALAGCSTYQKRWEAARAGGSAYEGRWESSKMPGTGGHLWCILDCERTGDYRALFKATWHGIFRSEHEAVLGVVSREGKTTKFTGRAKLDTWIGSGEYRCDGELRPDGISAEYDASYDQGRFFLKKAAAK